MTKADKIARAVIKKAGLKKEGQRVVGLPGVHQAILKAFKNTGISVDDLINFCNRPPVGEKLLKNLEKLKLKVGDFLPYFEHQMRHYRSAK
ncbi:MAG: hypothetical protein HYT93_04775 [Parcubacteria group bacterium]|nr:hypothetical protein [Parcubacteria group bacterium]